MFKNISKSLKGIGMINYYIIVAITGIIIIMDINANDSKKYFESLIFQREISSISGFWEIIVIALIGSILATSIGFSLYGLGELIEKVSVNTQNQTLVAQTNRQPGDNEWQCPNCGRINQNYVGTCGCGTQKNNTNIFDKEVGSCDLCNKTNVGVVKVVINDDMGTRYRKVCKSCFKNNDCKLDK